MSNYEEKDWMGVARAIAADPKLGLTDVERELAALVVKLAKARAGVSEYVRHRLDGLDKEITELQQPLWGVYEDDELTERRCRLAAAQEMRSALSPLARQ
jgi:hypothetical protein